MFLFTAIGMLVAMIVFAVGIFHSVNFILEAYERWSDDFLDSEERKIMERIRSQ